MLLFASDKSMKYFASLLILIGSFVLIWSASEIFFSMNSADRTNPVSYTHLDVYKRQTLYFLVVSAIIPPIRAKAYIPK